MQVQETEWNCLQRHVILWRWT